MSETFANEATIKSQVRFSDFDTNVSGPLRTVEEVKAWFGITDTTHDTQLALAVDAVSAAIRGYTGRVLTSGTHTETFRDVMDIKPERYLQEIPVASVTGALLLNKRTGRVTLTGGPELVVEYEGGYTDLPADLTVVFYELVRQQMGAWGVEQLGNAKPADDPREKAVWLGSLKVEYAISATAAQAKASGAGGISEAALAPYANVLDQYRAFRTLVAT
jgi:hypothetical protein